VPLLRTEDNRPLWVGRRVDPSPIAEIRWAMSWRVLSLMFVLSLIILFLARRFAHRAEELDTELTKNISYILEQDKAVDIKWGGPHEIQELANKLNELSRIHQKNTSRLKAHAKEMEESNRYKSDFLANVSHELRTPLNSILVLSKLLKQDTGLDKETIEKADVIHKAGTDLHGLIDNILELSRVETLDEHITPQDVNIKQLLEDIQMLMQPQFDEKGLLLSLIFEKQVPKSITSDPDKIRQIIKNLLSNALKFTRSGGKLHTSLKRRVLPRGRIRMSKRFSTPLSST